MASHPLDYYWLWTPESWTWSSNSPAEYSNIVADIKIACEALHMFQAPFQLATAGWVLGPVQDRAAFARDLPPGVAMSAISRDLGYVPVDAGFDRVKGREKWAILRLESDGYNGLAAVQLWLAGCAATPPMRWPTGVPGRWDCTGAPRSSRRHSWRSPKPPGTRVGTPTASAARPTPLGAPPRITRPNAPLPRSLPCDDFYADWARANFGQEDIGKIFAAIDGKVPPAWPRAAPPVRSLPMGHRGMLSRPGLPSLTSWRRRAPAFMGPVISTGSTIG